jgi:hypothetical protein
MTEIGAVAVTLNAGNALQIEVSKQRTIGYRLLLGIDKPQHGM